MKLTCDCGPQCMDHGSAGGCRYVAANEGPQLCDGDGRPCYVSPRTEDAHWRCGTAQCGSDHLAGRTALANKEDR